LRSLYCCSDGVRGRVTPVTNLSHAASFYAFERIAPSNRGIKQPCSVSGRNRRDASRALDVAENMGPASRPAPWWKASHGCPGTVDRRDPSPHVG
jgi:hypothetical protein